MENTEKLNFIIEVKTKWEPTTTNYKRKVIEYTCPSIFDETDESIYTKFLEPTMVYEEETNSINKNEIEIKAIKKDTKTEIKEPNTLVKTLLEFTTYHWLDEE